LFLQRCIEKKGDYFLSAQEAVNWGFADALLDNWHDQIEAIKAGFTK